MATCRDCGGRCRGTLTCTRCGDPVCETCYIVGRFLCEECIELRNSDEDREAARRESLEYSVEVD